MLSSQRMSRRRFIRHTSLVSLATAAPIFVPASVLGKAGPASANERVIIGFVGTGNRARQLMDHVPATGQIVAISDCYRRRMAETLELKKSDWTTYHDYHEMFDKEHLDAVVIATPDHGRTLPCIHACQAGLDVYAEKPLTLTIAEGQVLVRWARKEGTVFQVGSQQRTMEMNRFACQVVRAGGLGKIKSVRAVNYPGPSIYQGLPEEPIPEGDDWDRWCGPTQLRPFNHALQFAWMQWRAYSGGEMTNWGAHGVDQIQWALGQSLSGPIEIWPLSPEPDLNSAVHMRYADGTPVQFDLTQGPMGGAIFVGEHCKMEINRNKFTTNPADFVSDQPEPAVAKKWEGPGWIARPHIQNWLDCIKTRSRPNADVEIGHRSISVCHLANIARQLGRKLAWDPQQETFRDDLEANSYLARPRRPQYELPAA